MEDSRQIYENFRRVFVQGKQEPVWYNVHTRRPANSEIAKVLDEAEQKLNPTEKMEAVQFLKIFPAQESSPRDLPKNGLPKGLAISEPGSELPKLIENLTATQPSRITNAINASSEVPGISPGISSSGVTETPIKETRETFPELEMPKTDDSGAPIDSELDAEKTIVENLNTVFAYALDKLTSIDNNINDLVSYFKQEETEEDKKEDEVKAEEIKLDAERVKAEKEESVEKLVQRGEALETENAPKPEGKFSKFKRKFGEDLRLNLASQLPWLSLFSDKFDTNKIGMEEESANQKDGTNALLGGIGGGLAGGAIAGGARMGGAALVAGGAKLAGGAALAAGTGLSLRYLSDATGVSSFLSQNVLGTSKEEADKAAAQRVQESTNFMDELLGVKRVAKEDGSLDWKKTWGFENPLDVAEDYLFRGEGPLAPTGSKFQERQILKPNANEISKPELNKTTTTLSRTAELARKTQKMQDSNRPPIQVINNYNTTNQGGATITTVNTGNHGGPIGVI